MTALTEATNDLIGRGVFASRPAAGIRGRIYIPTDVAGVIYRDNGSTWDAVTLGSALTVKDEGGALATDATSLDFVGAGVVASGTGAAKTITIAGASALTVEEVDGSPTDAAITKIVFPNDSVSIASHIATIRQVPLGSIGASVYHNTTQAVNVNVVLMNSELFDSDGFHSTSVNTDRLTIPAGLGGRYVVWYSAGLSSAAAAVSEFCRIQKNGAANVSGNIPTGASGYGMADSVVVDLAAGDYVSLFFTGNRTLGHASAFEAQSQFGLYKLDSGKAGQAIGAKAYHSTTQTVNNTTASLLLDSEEFDSDGFHSTSVNTERLTVPAGLGGKYLLTYHIHVPATTVINPQSVAWLRKNGASTIRGSAYGENVTGTPDIPGLDGSVSVVADLSAGDYVDIQLFTNDNLAVGHATSEYAIAFSILRLDSGAQVGGWQSWTATVTQSGAVTITAQNCRYMQVGSITHFEGTIDLGGAGSSGSAIVLGGQPAALQIASIGTIYSQLAGRIIGHGKIERGGVYFKSCDVVALSATDWRFVFYDDFNYAGAAGQNAAFALSSNDNISFVGSVPIA